MPIKLGGMARHKKVILYISIWVIKAALKNSVFKTTLDPLKVSSNTFMTHPSLPVQVRRKLCRCRSVLIDRPIGYDYNT